ncbi:MAG: ATP synthase F0 subunit B [Syntrophobacteraceae bacterium]|nr:ATP synthase F0 subunit B [Syntrophobacteraceae bacterium]
MVEINYSLLIQMANFLVFLFLMNFVLYRPIRRIVAERKRMILERQEGIEKIEGLTSSGLSDYDSKLREARVSGAQKIQELKAAGYEQEKELVREASEKTAGKVQELRGKIQKDVAAARKDLKQQVKTFSGDLAQKILGRKV